MTKKKRLFSLFMVSSLVAATVQWSSFIASASFSGALQFDADGKFTVMQMTDIQDDSSVDDRVVAVITKAIGRYHPDLVVFTGDNHCGTISSSSFQSSVNGFLAPLLATNTKFAVTFGNHDNDSFIVSPGSLTEQYNYYKSHGGDNFVDHDVVYLNGVGSGVIPVYPNGQTSGTPAYQIYLMDSNDNASSGSFDCPYTDQIDYYIQRSIRYPAVPSLWFMHIIVPDLYTRTMTIDSSGITGNSSPFSSNKYILTPSLVNWSRSSSTNLSDIYKETPSCANLSLYESAAHRSSPTYGSKTLYEAWRDYGNMKGAYFGHEHLNEFTVTTDNGIDLGYGESTGLYKTGGIIPYNDGNPGVSVYELDIDGSYTDEFSAETDLAQKYVSFKANGGTGTMRGQETKNTGIVLHPNAFTRPGYTFSGWSTSAGGSVQYTDGSFISLGSANVILYAVWQASQISVEAAEGSATVINSNNNFIYGLETGLTVENFESNFVNIIGDARLEYYPAGGGLCTGTKVNLVDNATDGVLNTYYIVIFGDVSGDANVDGNDAGIITEFENYNIAWDRPEDACCIFAGDLNKDGNVDATDAGIITESENYQLTLDQVNGTVL